MATHSPIESSTQLRPRVLIISPHASYRTAAFLAAAGRLQFDVLIASQGRHSIVAAYAEGLHVDLDRPEHAIGQMVNVARERPFAAVIGTDDHTTDLAARVAGALGLKHNPPSAVRLARRKDLARARLAQARVRVPACWAIDLRRPVALQIESIRFPCVLKPVSLSASRGVIRADQPEELLRAVARITGILAREPSGEEQSRILVEEFIPGSEIAVEGLLHDGVLEMLAIFDKPDPLNGPYFEETYYITPTRLDVATQVAVRAEVGAACRAYGLVDGPVHAECRLNEQGVWIIEVAARTIGGLCARLLHFGTGYGLEEIVLRHAVGEPIERVRHTQAAGVLMIPIPQHGILRRIEGLLAAEQEPYIEEVNIQVREGYELVPLPEGASYLGFIFARGPDAGAVEKALRRAHAALNIVVAPLFRMTAAAASEKNTVSESINAA